MLASIFYLSDNWYYEVREYLIALPILNNSDQDVIQSSILVSIHPMSDRVQSRKIT